MTIVLMMIFVYMTNFVIMLFGQYYETKMIIHPYLLGTIINNNIIH